MKAYLANLFILGVLFHELVATSKLHMRHVVAIRKEWVEDLLPRLQQADVAMLNGEVAQELPVVSSETVPQSRQDKQDVVKAVRSDETKSAKSKIEEARERYLNRKRERDGSVKR